MRWRAPKQVALMSEKHVQVIELRGNGGLGVFLRVGDDQRLYRVAPVRDPGLRCGDLGRMVGLVAD